MESRDQTDHRKGAPAPGRASYRSGFFFSSLSFLGTTGFGLVSTIVTSRIYGVDIIGEYALVFAPVGVLNLLSSVKEQKALVKEITGLPPRHPRVTQLFAVVFTFSWGLTVLVSVLAAIACWFLFQGPLDAPYLLAPTYVSIAAYVVLTNTALNIDAVFSAFVAARQVFWVRLHETVAIIVIAAAVGLQWKSVWGLVIATVGAAITALIHRLILVRQFIRPRLTLAEYRLGMQVLPDLLRFGIAATPGQIAQGASQQGGVWALGVTASTAVVGAYSRALSLPQRVQQASLRIAEVLYPTLVGRRDRGDGHGFDRALIDSIRYEMIGLLALAAILGGAAHSVLSFFGPGFDQAAPALALLAIFPALASITVAQTQALWAVDKPGVTSMVAIVRLVLTIVLLIVLTPPLGVTGPAIAMLAGFLVMMVLSGYVLRPHMARGLRHSWPLRERIALCVAYVAGFLAAHGAEMLFPTTLGILLCVIAGTLAFALAFLLCGGLNTRDHGRLDELLAGIRRRFEERALNGKSTVQGELP